MLSLFTRYLFPENLLKKRIYLYGSIKKGMIHIMSFFNNINISFTAALAVGMLYCPLDNFLTVHSHLILLISPAKSR